MFTYIGKILSLYKILYVIKKPKCAIQNTKQMQNMRITPNTINYKYLTNISNYYAL